MSNCMFFTRNRFDAAALSGGSWEATLPLTNLQDRKLSKVARSTDEANASTKLVADLGADYYVRGVSLHKTNLSRAGKYRIMGATASTQFAALTPANLTAEYGIGLWTDCDYTIAIGANFDPDDWSFSMWVRPNWASAAGGTHLFAMLYADATNYMSWGFDANGRWNVTVVAAGTTKSVVLAHTFSADTWVFFGARLNAGTLTIYADTDGDGDITDNTASVAAVPVSTGAGWTGYLGSDQLRTLFARAYLNMQLTCDGSAVTPITDRFGAGAGLALGGDMGWLAKASGNGLRNSENLVFSLGANAAGTAVEINTAQGATDLLAGTATGRADLSTGNYLTTADPGAGADGIAAASWGFTIEGDEVANNVGLVGRWDGADNQFLVERRGATVIRVYVADAGADAANYADFDVTSLVAGTDYKCIVTYAAGTLALYYKAENATTRKFGAQSAPAPAVTGVIPVALRASALGYTFGGPLIGANEADGKLDDVRISNSVALTSAQADADQVNEPNPALWTYWWPLDGAGTDGLALGLTASWTGAAAYVDDGRHQLGRGERYMKAGAYYTDGVDDGISLGNYVGLDAAAAFTMWGVHTVGQGSGNLGGCWKASTNERQWLMLMSGNLLACYLSGDGTAYRSATGNTALPNDTEFAWWLRYSGAGAADADKLKMGVAVYDPATGTFGAFVEQVLAFAGTAASVPASLSSVGAAAVTYFGRSVDGGSGTGYGKHLHDEWRFHIATAIATAALNAQSVYYYDAATWTDGYDFDGDANSREGVMPNGVVAGAIQWYDGRQPEGLTNTSLAQIDRATGANQSSEGTYGIRLKGDAAGDRLNKTTAALTVGRWTVLVGDARETAAGATLTMAGNAFTVAKDASVPTQATMAAVGISARVDVADTASVRAIVGNAAEAYFDNLRALQLAVIAPATSDDGYVEDSTWLDAYPEIYPAGVLAIGDEGYADNKLSALDYAAGYRVDPIVRIITARSARYWAIQFDDTTNADGYVQLGRVWIDYGYQPSQNMIVGAGLGWRDPSTRTESDGTDALYDVRTPRRIYDFAFDYMGEDESLVRLFELCRRGITAQLLFVSNPSDTHHMHRRSMLAVLETLSPLKNVAAVFYDQAYSLVEEI